MARASNPQRDKRTKAARAAANGSSNVPILKQAVVDLCDIVDTIDERLALLERAPQSGSGSGK